MDFLLESYVTGGRIKSYFTADTDKTGSHVDLHRLTDWLRGYRQAKTDRHAGRQTHRQSDRQYVLDFVRMLTSIAGLTSHIYYGLFTCARSTFDFLTHCDCHRLHLPAKWAD